MPRRPAEVWSEVNPCTPEMLCSSRSGPGQVRSDDHPQMLCLSACVPAQNKKTLRTCEGVHMVAQVWNLRLFGHAEGGLLALSTQAALDPVVVPRRDAEHRQLCLSLAVCTRHHVRAAAAAVEACSRSVRRTCPSGSWAGMWPGCTVRAACGWTRRLGMMSSGSSSFGHTSSSSADEQVFLAQTCRRLGASANPATFNTAHDSRKQHTLSMQHASCGKGCQPQQPCQPQGLTRVHAAAHGRSPAHRL